MKVYLFILIALITISCESYNEYENQQSLVQESSMKQPTPDKSSTMYPQLEKYFEKVEQATQNIEESRKEALIELAELLKEQKTKPLKLNFICTHNSRRSHLAQIWAATAAEKLDLDYIQTYSGGTEATAFNPRAVAAMQRAGFVIKKTGENDNPRYQVTYMDSQLPMTCFSKKYSDETNPKEDFIAIMVCSSADKSCPIVDGATARYAIPYVDPKIADGTDQEANTYDERCFQIAAEMYFLFTNYKEGL